MADIVHGRKTYTEKVRALLFSKRQFVHRRFRHLLQVSVRVGTGLPLGVERGISASAVGLSAQRMGERGTKTRGSDRTEGRLVVPIRCVRQRGSPSLTVIGRYRMGLGVFLHE